MEFLTSIVDTIWNYQQQWVTFAVSIFDGLHISVILILYYAVGIMTIHFVAALFADGAPLYGNNDAVFTFNDGFSFLLTYTVCPMIVGFFIWFICCYWPLLGVFVMVGIMIVVFVAISIISAKLINIGFVNHGSIDTKKTK